MNAEHLQKLMAQLALLFVVLWVVGAALGKKSQVTLSGSSPQNVPGGSNPYGGCYSHYGSALPYQASPARAPWAV